MDRETDSDAENAADVWSDSTRLLSNSADVGDSIIYHDPIKEINGDESEKIENPVFTAIARNKSVVIAVDKWSSDLATVKETPPDNVSMCVRAENSHLIATDDDAIYSVVDKPFKAPKIAPPQNGPVDDSYYAQVNKQTKTEPQKQNGSKNNLTDDDDIGNSDDLQKDPEDRRYNENVYTCIDGRIMMVSDEGDYASVDTLSISENSKTTGKTRDSIISLESRATELGSQISESKPKSENDFNKQQSRYALRYLGSLPITEQELAPPACNQVVGQCIVRVMQNSSQNSDIGLTYEWQKDANMILEISETKKTFKLLNSSSGKTYEDHFLGSIRIWAVGKEKNSKYFAYVIRNSAQRHVCRVFFCDVAACRIVATIRNICHKLATQNKIPVADLTPGPVVSKVSASEANREKRQPPKGVENLSGAASEVSSAKPTTMTCSYMGMVPVSNPSGKETVNAATKKVFLAISKDVWKAASIEFLPANVCIRDISKSDGVSRNLSVESITHVGMSTKNKNLAAIIVKDTDEKFHAHVFFCEQSAKEFVQKVQAACQTKISTTETKQKGSKDEIPKQKSLGKFFNRKQSK